MKIRFLTIEEIKMIHVDQVNRYGGLHGLRDESLLDSAINYPKAAFGKKYLHSTIYDMAAAYMCSIIKNHPFLDGNKRTGLIVALLFLAYNDISINAHDDELFNLTVSLAQSQMTEKEIAVFFEQKTIRGH